MKQREIGAPTASESNQLDTVSMGQAGMSRREPIIPSQSNIQNNQMMFNAKGVHLHTCHQRGQYRRKHNYLHTSSGIYRLYWDTGSQASC